VTKGGTRKWLFVAVLVIVPSVLWISAAAVPFLPLVTATRLWLAPALIVAAGVVFWIAALFVGREMISRYHRFFDPRKGDR